MGIDNCLVRGLITSYPDDDLSTRTWSSGIGPWRDAPVTCTDRAVIMMDDDELCLHGCHGDNISIHEVGQASQKCNMFDILHRLSDIEQVAIVTITCKTYLLRVSK